jgi:ribosomal protein S14
MRLNAPYDIAFGVGEDNGKEHPEWTEAEIAKHAYFLAHSMVVGVANRAVNRYFRELAHAYIVGVAKGQTGQMMTEDEWCEKYGHPREVYQKMLAKR